MQGHWERRFGTLFAPVGVVFREKVSCFAKTALNVPASSLPISKSDHQIGSTSRYVDVLVGHSILTVGIHHWRLRPPATGEPATWRLWGLDPEESIRYWSRLEVGNGSHQVQWSGVEQAWQGSSQLLVVLADWKWACLLSLDSLGFKNGLVKTNGRSSGRNLHLMIVAELQETYKDYAYLETLLKELQRFKHETKPPVAPGLK